MTVPPQHGKLRIDRNGVERSQFDANGNLLYVTTTARTVSPCIDADVQPIAI